VNGYEVIQICRTVDGITVSDCRQVPVNQIMNGGVSGPSLSELMPVLLACGGLMALAWGIKRVIRTLGE